MPPAHPSTGRSCSRATSTATRPRTRRPHRRLSAAGFANVAARLPEAARPPGTWDPANPLNRDRASGKARRVDHIFVRPRAGHGVEASDVRIVLDEPAVPVPDGDALPLSDHYGLLATLTPG